MASLESLSNPLERLLVLPTAVQARGAAGDITWDANIQYYRNDIVISPTTGGAYVFTGGVNSRSSIFGGSDPAADTTGVWTRLQGNGPSELAVFAAAAPIVGAGNTYTLPAGASLAVGEGQLWSITAQGTVSTAAATVAGEFSTLTFTPNGAGAVASSVAINPIVDTATTATPFAFTTTVLVGTGGTSITASGAYATATVGTLTGLRITYARLA